MTGNSDRATNSAARAALVLVLTALAYAAVGWLALELALPPSYASPIFPSAGIALAAALVFGLPGVLGAGLGAFLVNLSLAAARGQFEWLAIALLPAAIGVGAALQATAGLVLVRRFVGAPFTLSTPRDILRFSVLGGAVAGLVNSLLSTGALALAGVVPRAEIANTWWTWWVGDLLGVLIGAPIALTLIGRPRRDWAPRRLSVGLPMLIGALLLAAAAVLFSRWEVERLRAAFEHRAASTGSAVEGRLHEAVHAVQALRSAFATVPAPTGETLRNASAWWLAHAEDLQALGYSERVSRADVAAFEARARADGLGSFRVFDRADSAGIATRDADVVAIRMIEPLATNERALGVNALSIDAAREAVLQAARSGAPTATRTFRLTQTEREETGVVLYQALYAGNPATDAQRQAAFRGVVFVTLRLDRALEPVVGTAANPLGWCLVDTAAKPGPQRVAGPSGCELASTGAFQNRQAVGFGGRTWELRLSANANQLPGGQHDGAWLFSIVGLAATSLLGMLLLTVTGRARRIELAVDERTAALTHEIADRRAAEAALRESEQRQRDILDHVPIGVLFLDTRGFILDANPRLCEMLGRSADALRQLSAADLVNPQDMPENRALMADLMRGAIPIATRQTRLRRADGSELQVRVGISLLRDASGQPQRLVGVVEDITEHLRLAETERARDAAEAASRAKSEFVSRMSHELRTPLNAMLGFAQLLGMDRKPALTAQQLGWASQIQRAGWHLLEMINDTLDLARIEAGMVELNLQALELAPLVRASSALLGAAADKRGIVLAEELDPRASAVMGDETRLKQVLTNLLSNAVKYNRDGGRITVQSRLVNERLVEIVVRDTGLGMSATQLAALFQPYNRLGRESSSIEGTGIGLVISRRLAELMGGTLRASSTEGAGSSFTLRLARAAFTDSGSPIRGAPEAAPAYHRRRVHYIEDNETNIEVMRGILAQRPQIDLEVSMYGLDGLAAVRQRRPDLILLDMHLPDIGGIELLRHLKNDDTSADIPVVVVSADASPARVEEALTLGAAHYLTKPVDITTLLATLDQTLTEIETRWG
jgi:PAS domain S-box-containing protein